MIASQIVDWLNENEYRGYPLRENTLRTLGNTGLILDPIILDANFVYSTTALPEAVKLESINITANLLTITVTGQQPFIIELLNVVFPVYSRNADGSLLVIGEAIRNAPTGNYVFPNTVFEDSVSVEVNGTWKGVTSLQFPNHSPLTGTIEWTEGYQFDIKIKGSTIHLGANSNYGKPISCEKFFEGEVDYDCDDLVSFINGASTISNPDIMRFVAGPNIAVYDDPDHHRIYIGLNFEEKDVCKTPVSNPES